MLSVSLYFSADGYWQKNLSTPELHLYTNYSLNALLVLSQTTKKKQKKKAVFQHSCFTLVFCFLCCTVMFWINSHQRRRGCLSDFKPLSLSPQSKLSKVWTDASLEWVTSGRYKDKTVSDVTPWKQEGLCYIWMSNGLIWRNNQHALRLITEFKKGNVRICLQDAE